MSNAPRNGLQSAAKQNRRKARCFAVVTDCVSQQNKIRSRVILFFMLHGVNVTFRTSLYKACTRSSGIVLRRTGIIAEKTCINLCEAVFLCACVFCLQRRKFNGAKIGVP